MQPVRFHSRRLRPFVFLGTLLLAPLGLSTVAVEDARADFDPSGRGKKPGAKPGGKPGAKPGAKPTGDKPTGAKPTGDKPTGVKPTGDKPTGDKPTEEGRSNDQMIARYTAIVLQQPSATFPIQRLAQLYRERDGDLKKLLADFEQRSAGSGDDAWAAKVALAGMLKQDGRHEAAIGKYESAIADKPKEPGPLMALAQLHADRGDKALARTAYEKAVPLLKVSAEIEQTTRTIMQLSLDLKDFTTAKKQHDELVKKSQGSLFVKAELGRELFTRQEFEKAEVEFRELVKAAAGDNRALAPALKDLGSVLAKQKKMSEALEHLKKALAIAGSGAGIRAEIMAIMADAFRAEGKISELIAILEKEPGSDFHRHATLGTLYEETGDVEKALAAYRKALASESRNIDVRVKLVHLLQTAGQLELAIKEYEALIKAAPQSSEYVFELCETLIQRGDRPKALALLKELEGRADGDGDVLSAVADFYERVEEKDKAMAVLQRLANTASGDPTFLIDLGDRYYQAGDKKKALDTWAKIKTLVPNRAKAAFSLGEVYLDHDMPDEALASLREAVGLEPENMRFKKGLAIALERAAAGSPFANDRFSEAVRVWQEILATAKNDENLARESRTHIVSIWSVQKELPQKVTPLKARFESTPPDIEAGRLLAEVQRKMAKLSDAEATLRKLVGIAKGDIASYLILERVLVQQQNLKGAIEVLEKLATIDKKGERQYFQRMAQYAAELYQDDDAIRYATKAVELSPEDANGHKKLGDMHRKRQDYEKAISEYRQAIAKNDRLFPVYFDLAELVLTSGDSSEADRLLRRVVRASGDEELVARAARMSMQVNLGKGTLESLERELLPVAVGNPHKPLYRRLLVELYGTMTMPLVQKIRHTDRSTPAGLDEVEKARGELRAIGGRAIKPLLDALSDDKESQQRVAIEVLAYVENKNAGPSLFNFALSGADKGMRARAMVATGALKDEALLPRYEELLFPKESSPQATDELAIAATWGVARIATSQKRSDRAEKILVKLLDSQSPDVRAVAAVGLGLTRNREHAERLAALAESGTQGALAKSGALLGAVELLSDGGSKSAEALSSLAVSSTDATELVLRRAAIAAVVKLSSLRNATPREREALAESVFSADEAVRRDAAFAISSITAKKFARAADPLAVPDGPLRPGDILDRFRVDPRDPEARVRGMAAFSVELGKAAASAVATSPTRAAFVVDSLKGDRLAPFIKPQEKLEPKLADSAGAASREISAKVVQNLLHLVDHPDKSMRMKAVEFIATRSGSEVEEALGKVLDDADDSVVRAGLAALAASGVARGDALSMKVATLAKSGKTWALRVRACETLAVLGKTSESASTRKSVRDVLASLAETDSFALVREAAAVSLFAVDGEKSRSLLQTIAKNDGEPRVRASIEKLLSPPKAPRP